MPSATRWSRDLSTTASSGREPTAGAGVADPHLTQPSQRHVLYRRNNLAFNSARGKSATRERLVLREPDTLRSAILVDPHPLWLEAVEEALGSAVHIAAKASSLEEAQPLIEKFQPDVVVAEIAVGGDKVDGLAWLRATVEQFQTKVIVLTASGDPQYIDAALACGASAYVLKTAHPDDLRATVRQAFQHSIYLPPRNHSPGAVSPRLNQEQHDLTRRELEILFLVAEGHSNAKLAKMLWVTEQTVKFHLSNIYRKIGVSNRTEASRWAQLQGLLPGDSAPDQVA